MKAVVYSDVRTVAVQDVPDATIEVDSDAVVRVTSSALCGSDLHMYDGRTGATAGLVLGHEPLGVVEQVGRAVETVTPGPARRPTGTSRCRGVPSSTRGPPCGSAGPTTAATPRSCGISSRPDGPGRVSWSPTTARSTTHPSCTGSSTGTTTGSSRRYSTPDRQTRWAACSGRGRAAGRATWRRRTSSATAISSARSITPAAHSSVSDTAAG
jgi:hypothetical protein